MKSSFFNGHPDFSGNQDRPNGKGFSFHRHPLLSVLILFFLLEMISSVVFYWQMIEKTPFSYAITAILADLILPVLMVTMAYFFKSRVFAVLAVCSMSLILFIKIANNIIFGRMYSIICYGTCKVLLGHADHHSLSILFGRFYYIWLIFCIFLFLYLLV